MKYHRNCIPVTAFAAIILLALGGCKSSSNQPAADATQPAANSSQPAAGQSAASSSQPAVGQSAARPSSASSSPGAPASAAQSAPPPPAVVNLPAGTQLRVRLDEDLGSKINRPGDSFTATVADDVVVNGQTVIPQGSRVDGTVVDAQPLGHFKGGALLQIQLDRVHTQWGSYPVDSSSIQRIEKGKGKRTALFAGGGGALGALIGGLAGGGKGAAIGALTGAGAGTAGGALTGNQQIVLPAETLLTFQLERSVRIVEGQ